MTDIAALYVQTGGAYFGLPGVDPWDEPRDARNYGGPHPVVAHPPCNRWCQQAYVNQARYGHRVGDDGGCFAAALAAVRAFGGALEHPAKSHAWKAFGLVRPPTAGGWAPTGDGGFVCHVEQCHYGHAARKATWLLVYGVPRGSLPDLTWGPGKATAIISSDGPRSRYSVRQLGKKEASATPAPFKEILLSIARSVTRD